MVLLLLACVHTPPHDPVPGTWTIDVVHRAQLTMDGLWCSWDAENLSFSGEPIWSAQPPDLVDGEHSDAWCEVGGEAGRTVDVLAQDGPFLSTRIRDEGCCPEQATVDCVTWDLRTRRPAPLEAFDERHADWRWEKLQARLAEDPALNGYTFRRDAFLVRGGHVTFCGIAGAEVVEVQVR